MDPEGSPAAAGVPPEAAQATLEKLLASPRFSNTRRLSEFLRFAALEAIAGDTALVDESRIAIEIYGRDRDYDPKVDSIVRVEANRLRAKLRDYYEAEGRDDLVRIRLPLESYVPVFEAAPQPAPQIAAARRRPLRLTLAATLAGVTTDRAHRRSTGPERKAAGSGARVRPAVPQRQRRPPDWPAIACRSGAGGRRSF
jgi:hypothetical protein